MIRRLAIVLCVVSVGFGCSSMDSNKTDEFRPYARDSRRDTDKANRLQAKAVQLMQNDQLDEAEKEFKTALAADLFNGQAHNNLGVIYYQEKRYYQAAWEFQYATKLMPNKAEPLNNLGMVFEAVGKLDDAAEWYEKAISLEPNNAQVTGNLARAYVRTGRKDERARQCLTDVLMKDQRPEWIAWAKERLSSMGPLEESSDTSQPVYEEDKQTEGKEQRDR